jgi:class 3 adenylate cyclase
MPEEKKREGQAGKTKEPNDKTSVLRPETGASTVPSHAAIEEARRSWIKTIWEGERARPSATDEWARFSDLLRTNLNDALIKEVLESRARLRPQLGELESEISKLKSEINQKAQALLEQSLDTQQKEEKLRDLEGKFQALSEKQRFSHLLTRVGTAAQQKLLESPEFRALFDRESPCSAYVLSIDIRRSTDLMLKAREPKLFAQFITRLASQLRDVILENYGIFDKFTGDGILAFFPEFYSGSDAGYFALKAANSCHRIFAEHYEKNKHCFISVLLGTGLGIGIDYGPVQIVQIGGDFTVVGTPVVYACRMGGADAQHTYLNQPAFEQLFEKYSSVCDFDRCEIDIKHEGKTLAYCAELNGKSYSPAIPPWNVSEKPAS